MSDDYLRMTTQDPNVVLLYNKNEAPPDQPDASLLKRLRTLARPGRALFYARQAENAAKSRVKQRREKFLSQYPVGQAAGCIVRYGKQWFRLIVTPKPTPTIVKEPAQLVEYAGEQLPQIASTLTIVLTSVSYLQLAGALHQMVQGVEWQIAEVKADPDVINSLIAKGKLPALPEGILVTGETPEPNVVARPAGNPHNIKKD